MDTLLKKTEIARRLSDGKPEKSALLERRMRSLEAKGILNPAQYEGIGKTSAALYTFQDMCLIALAMHLVDKKNYSEEMIAKLFSSLKPMPLNIGNAAESMKVDGGISNLGNVGNAIRGIESGEGWLLEIEFRGDVPEISAKTLAVSQIESASATVERILASVGKHLVSADYVSLNALFGPLIEAAKLDAAT